MFDPSGQALPSLCSSSHQSLCYYITRSSSLKMISRKSHHYEQDSKCQIVYMVENICKELFQYSSGKNKSTQKQKQTLFSLLIDNVSKIVMDNADQYGIIIEQSMFLLVVSFINAHKQKQYSQLFNQCHWLLTAKSDQDLPYFTTLLLNSQFQQILCYVKQVSLSKPLSKQVQSLIDLLIMRIQKKQNQANQLINESIQKKLFQKIKKEVSLTSSFKELQIILNQNNRVLSNTLIKKYQLDIIMGVLLGNQKVVEAVGNGSWALYLSLFINYVQPNISSQKRARSYQALCSSYINSYGTKISKKASSTLSVNQHFLLSLISGISSGTCFHSFYQQSFNLFSPILCHLLGLLSLQSQTIDLYSIVNNKEYYEDVVLGLLEAAANTSWLALVYSVGFVANSERFKAKDLTDTYQYLFGRYLKYQLDYAYNHEELVKHVIGIQDKVQDLNFIGVGYFAQKYLNTLLDLQLSVSRSNKQVNPVILQIFYLCIQQCGKNSVNQVIQRMQNFLSINFQSYSLDPNIIYYLQYILIQRKCLPICSQPNDIVREMFKSFYQIAMIKQLSSQQNIQKRQNVSKQIALFLEYFNQETIQLNIQWLYCIQEIVNNVRIVNKEKSTKQSNKDIQVKQKNNLQVIPRDIMCQFKTKVLNYVQKWKNQAQQQVYLKSSKCLSQIIISIHQITQNL